MKDNTLSASVKAINQKPHKFYIVYLITKKWSPKKIISNLHQLGLSAVTQESLMQYYNVAIKPEIKRFNLGHIYHDYSGRMIKSPDYKWKNIPELSFRAELGDNIDDQINFLKLIKYLEVEKLWGAELYTFYGKKEKVPTDPDTGLCLIESFGSRNHMPWSILNSPYRYVVDELILEGVENYSIQEHMEKNYDLKISADAIKMYKLGFFSLKLTDIKEKIKSIEVEKYNLIYHVKNIESEIKRQENGESSGEDSVPELLLKKKSLYGRIGDLDNMIKTLTANFSETAARQKIAKGASYRDIFEEMMEETYSKFKKLSKHDDRAIVNPMFKLTRMMSIEFDLLQKAKDLELRDSDGAQAQLIQFVTERIEEVGDKEESEIERLEGEKYRLEGNLEMDDIEGLEEIIDDDDDKDDE